MLYMELYDEHKRPVSTVFSTTDNMSELDTFRAQVHAPKVALVTRAPRPHLVIFGKPREEAKYLVTKTLDNPIARREWELQQGIVRDVAQDTQTRLPL